MLTIQDAEAALPPHLRTAVTQELVDLVNAAGGSDPDAARLVRESFVSYGSVMKDSRFRLEDYLNAVVYVSFKLMGHSNREAYAKTFPQRYQVLLAKGASDKDISAYVAAFNKNKLVNQVLEQSMIPSWVLNQDAYQEAINVQVKLMTNPNVSDKVRTEAANSLLTHLKPPEKKHIQLDLGVTETSGMTELRETLTLLAQRQRELISGGTTTREIAHQPLSRRTPVRDMIDVTPTKDASS